MSAIDIGIDVEASGAGGEHRKAYAYVYGLESGIILVGVFFEQPQGARALEESDEFGSRFSVGIPVNRHIQVLWEAGRHAHSGAHACDTG